MSLPGFRSFKTWNFHQNGCYKAPSECLSEYSMVPVFRYIVTITVLKRGKQRLLEYNISILNMASTSKPTAANSFKQYFAAHGGTL